MRCTILGLMMIVVLCLSGISHAQSRSPVQDEYAAKLWKYVGGSDGDYRKWQAAAVPLDDAVGPPAADTAKVFVNERAAASPLEGPAGSMIVTEHFTAGIGNPVAVTVRLRAAEGYNRASGDWYWAHYLPDGTVVQTVADVRPYAKRGFVAFEEDGRLWVFRVDAIEMGEYLTRGELAKHVIRPAAGPSGVTLKAPDAATIDAYLVAAEGFETRIIEGRVWVFRSGSEELKEFSQNGELAKHVIRPVAGPAGMTIKAPDAETIDAYLLAISH